VIITIQESVADQEVHTMVGNALGQIKAPD
jgi:hypothetical protein